jgi:hypothetical protein
MVGAYVPARESQWVVEIYWQLFDGARIVVIWNFALLRELDLL